MHSKVYIKQDSTSHKLTQLLNATAKIKINKEAKIFNYLFSQIVCLENIPVLNKVIDTACGYPFHSLYTSVLGAWVPTRNDDRSHTM